MTHLAFILVNYILYDENNQAVDGMILSTAFVAFRRFSPKWKK